VSTASSTCLEAMAAALDGAALNREALSRPLTDGDAGLDATTAYEVQRSLVGKRLERGNRVVGVKLGLTSAAKQRQMQVGEPLYGWLTSDMVVDPAAPVDLDAFIHVRAEPEIAFLIGREIAAPATVTSVLAATDAVFAAIELIDSRYEGFRFRHPDVVADNASAAGFVVGSVARPAAEVGDLRLLGTVVRRNGVVVGTAAGAAALGHPASAVAWMVNRLAERGERLEPGSIVLSGALTDAFPLEPGTVVTVEIEALGTVEVRA
jgi:2-oxo-3-hexenedioate decarboxylase